MSLSRKGVIASLTVAATLAAHQHYLSQYDTQSQFYWRNLHTFSDLMFQTAHYKHIDHLLSMSKVIAAADLDVNQFIQFMLAIPNMRRLKKLFDKLDDIVDNATAEAVLSLGEATLGREYSPFLLQLLDQEDLRDINQLIEDGMITSPEMISFCNLLANKLYIQASLSTQYHHEANQSMRAILRKTIAQENIEISGCYMTLAIHFIKKDPRLTAIVHDPLNTGMNYVDLQSVYPRSTKAGELMQIAHDTPEFRYDLKNETSIGKISANYFLAELESANVLQESKAELQQLPDRPVTMNELPKKTQTVLLKTEHHFQQEAARLGPSVKVVYNLAWQYEKRVGFFAEKPRHHSSTLAVPKKLSSKL